MNFLLSEVLAPLARRAGTIAGTFVATIGATAPQVEQVEAIATGAVLITVDLITSYINRHRRASR